MDSRLETEKSPLLSPTISVGFLPDNESQRSVEGFLGEEESRGRTTTISSEILTSEGRSNIVKERGSLPMEKEINLTKFNGGSKLGFRDGASASAVNGDSQSSPSPVDFNIEEFLNLANKVVDRDEAAMAALKVSKGAGRRNLAIADYSDLGCLLPVSGDGKRVEGWGVRPADTVSSLHAAVSASFSVNQKQISPAGNFTPAGSSSPAELQLEFVW
ncbi:UNVERIFIED_CONTAM: hypothetical protein Sindi_1272300 [Sesamum indicum]